MLIAGWVDLRLLKEEGSQSINTFLHWFHFNANEINWKEKLVDWLVYARPAAHHSTLHSLIPLINFINQIDSFHSVHFAWAIPLAACLRRLPSAPFIQSIPLAFICCLFSFHSTNQQTHFIPFLSFTHFLLPLLHSFTNSLSPAVFSLGRSHWRRAAHNPPNSSGGKRVDFMNCAAPLINSINSPFYLGWIDWIVDLWLSWRKGSNAPLNQRWFKFRRWILLKENWVNEEKKKSFLFLYYTSKMSKATNHQQPSNFQFDWLVDWFGFALRMASWLAPTTSFSFNKTIKWRAPLIPSFDWCLLRSLPRCGAAWRPVHSAEATHQQIKFNKLTLLYWLLPLHSLSLFTAAPLNQFIHSHS